MSRRYLIPSCTKHTSEETIKRSRFLVHMAHAPDTESAKAFIDSIRAEHPDATHNCWAFAAGPPGDTAQVGMSDDGEPHGTAGKPMLSVLLHGEVGELAVVVTRYFGGVKLGTGGLVRAYSGMVQLGLDGLPTKEKTFPVRLEVVLDYSSVTLFKRLLPEVEAEVVQETFDTDAGFVVELPREHLQEFTDRVVELTSGEALLGPAHDPEKD